MAHGIRAVHPASSGADRLARTCRHVELLADALIVAAVVVGAVLVIVLGAPWPPVCVVAAAIVGAQLGNVIVPGRRQ